MAAWYRWRELVAVLTIFAGYGATLALTAKSADDLHVFSDGNASALAFQYRAIAGEVPVQVAGVPVDGDAAEIGVKEVKLVGSDVFLLTGDGELRRQSRFARRIALTGQDVEVVASDVLAFAVDPARGRVYYVGRDRVASAGDQQRTQWRLCLASCNLTLQRTLIGGGAAPAATAMAVDFANGYLFLLSRQSALTGVLTRTRLDGTAREEMMFDVSSPSVALSSLVVSQAAGKPSVFWLESTATYSWISRSLYTMRARKISRFYRPDVVQHMWASRSAVHFLEDLQSTEGPEGPAVVRSVLNKRLSGDTAFEASAATLPESSAQPTCNDTGNQICVPLASADGSGVLAQRCMLATVYTDGRPLSFAGTDQVLLAATGSQLVTIFLEQVDANNLTIAEPLHVQAGDWHVHGLAVDLLSRSGPRVFWSRRTCGASVLEHSKLDGTTHGVFERNGVSYPEAIAFDPVSRVVLWNDAGRQITAKSSDGRVRVATLGADGDRRIHGLVVDSLEGQMYWIEGTGRGRIMRAFLDGTGVTAVTTTNMASILAIDTSVTPSRFYWVEPTNNTASILKHVQGSASPQQFTPPLPVVPTTVVVGDTYIYLAHSMGVYKVAKGNGRSWSSIILIRSLPRVTSLAIIDFRQLAKAAPSNDFCGAKNGFCSELCLPSADPKRRCHCDPGRLVSSSVSNKRASTCRGPSPQVVLTGRQHLLALAINRQGQLSESALRLPPCPHTHAHDCFLLAVDPIRHHIYIAPRGGQVVYRHSYFSLDTQASGLTTVLHTGSREASSIHGLAFDERSSNLFWTDSKSHRVEAVHVDRSTGHAAHRTVLIWSGLRHPRHIVADPAEGLLYISLRGITSSVVKASMRGEILETVYRSSDRANHIRSVVLCKATKSLFISIGNSVLNVDLAPGYRSRTLHSCANTTCGHLAASGNNLYLTTNGPKSTLFTAKIQAQLGSLHPVSLGKLERMSNVTLSSPLVIAGDSAGSNESFGPCSDSWLCGGLCLPRAAAAATATQHSASTQTPGAPTCSGAHSSCYCPHGQIATSNGGVRCREPSEDEERLLVVSRDGTLRLVAVETSVACAAADDCDASLASTATLPLRLPGGGDGDGEPRSVTFDRRTDTLMWLDTASRSVASMHVSGRNHSPVYTVAGDSVRDMPRQIVLNEVSGYLYLVGGKERVEVVHRNGTYFGVIVKKWSSPHLLATDEASGLIFWIEDAKAADVIVWGAAFGQPKYSTFVQLRGAHAYRVTAMVANDHRLVYAEGTTVTAGTVRMCAFGAYDFATTDSYAQRMCQTDNILVLQRGTGNVSSLVVSGDMLYFTNNSGVWSVGIPLVNATHLYRPQPARLVLSGANIQSALLYRAKRSTNVVHRKPGGCELNNTCQYFCQSVGRNYICSCPLGMNLLADGRSCKSTGCGNTQHYCQLGAQIAGGLQRTDSGTCVPFTYECDHDCDCAGDCSDEGEFCECESDEMKCPKPDHFKCYKLQQRCDGVADCLNSVEGDERNCTVECPKKGELMCLKNGTNDPICVVQHNFCDGIKDCSDGMDEDELICGEDSSEDASLRYASTSGASNIVTGVLLGVLLLALGVAFAAFYCYQRGRGQRSKRSSQASMIDGDGAAGGGAAGGGGGAGGGAAGGGGGAGGRSDRYQDSSTSPSGSVTLSEGSDNPSNDSTMSPLSRDTIGPTSKSTETTRLSVALGNSGGNGGGGSESTEHTGGVGGGNGNGGRHAPSPDSSQKDSGHIEGDSPCALSNDDDSDSDDSDPGDECNYPDSINGSDVEEAPVSVPVPSALDDLFSITTDEVNKVPTHTTKTLLQVPGAADGRRHGDSNLVSHHPPSQSSQVSCGIAMTIPQQQRKQPHYQPASSARRPKPAPYGYHPRLEEYSASDDHLQVYNDCVSEDYSVVGGGDNGGGGPCPSECSQPMSFAGNLLVPCPSVCSAAYRSEVSASEFSFPSDMTSQSQYSVNDYPHLPKARVMTLPAYPSDLSDGRSDGRSDSLPADNYSLATGASSIGPPAAPCGSPVTVATMGAEE